MIKEQLPADGTCEPINNKLVRQYRQLFDLVVNPKFAKEILSKATVSTRCKTSIRFSAVAAVLAKRNIALASLVKA